MPIPSRLSPHLPSAICFASDASGAQFNKQQGRFIPIPFTGDRKAVSVNTIEEDQVWFFASVIFPRDKRKGMSQTTLLDANLSRWRLLAYSYYSSAAQTF
jgi:hypothetical protein